MSWKFARSAWSSSTVSSSSRMTCQFSSISPTHAKRSSGKKVASPTSERRPMNRSTGASTRSPMAIVHSTVRSHSDFVSSSFLDMRCLLPAVASREQLKRAPDGGPRLRGLAQSGQLGRLGELLQRPLLELRGALGREAEPLADRGEGLRLLAPCAEAERQHLALGFRQLRNRVLHDPLALVVPSCLLGHLGVRGQQVSERGVAIFADLLVEADERCALVAHLLDLLERQSCLLRELFERRLAPQAHRQLALDAAHLARALGHVD